MSDARTAPGSQEGTLSIYKRQVIALCHKNLKLFWRRPVVLILRVILLPIVIALLATVFRHIGSDFGTFYGNNDGGVSDPRAIKSVAAALENHDDNIFVFARNGFAREADPIIDRFASRTGVTNIIRIDDPAEIAKECRVTVNGASECFASIIFNSINGSVVDYILAFNPADFEGDSDWASHRSTVQDRIYPVQLAIDSAIANLPGDTIIQEQSFKEDNGFLSRYSIPVETAPNGEKKTPNTNAYYYFVAYLLAPLFILIFIEMVFHVCGFLTRERESGVTELLTTQGCRQSSQIISSFLSFWLLYIMTWIFTGIIIGEVLFVKTNTGFNVLFQVLAGTSLLSWCMFLSTWFKKGHFSSPVSAVLTLGLAVVSFKYFFDNDQFTGVGLGMDNVRTEAIALAAVFPPFTYAFLISDMARLESFASLGFNIIRSPEDVVALTGFRSFAPYLYIVFFLAQVPLYLGLAVGCHFSFWHVPYIVKKVAQDSGLAMRITGLSKTYKPLFKKSKGKAVDDLSLQVQNGQVVCLLGPNGGGKSTTLKCLGGVVKADKGSNMELGCDRTELGYCPQDNVIWPSLTVREHVDIWLMIKGRALSKAERDIVIEEMIRECDLAEKADAQASTLSGGQKRKLQLAIAFVGGSKIVCIDEASSGVDPLSRQNIWHIIQQGTSQRTILMTTHFLDEADVLADYVVIMSKGKLVVEGSSTALKAQHGDGYAIYSDSTLTNKVGHAKTSTEAAHKLEELIVSDPSGSKKYEVGFPTLEQVFLKVANGESLSEDSEGSDNDEEGATARESSTQSLEHGRPINKLRQIWVLFKKRYSVLPHNWLAIVVTLLIPIAVAAACMRGVAGGAWELEGLQNCQYNIDYFNDQTQNLQNSGSGSSSGSLPSYVSLESASSNSIFSGVKMVIGPQSVFASGTENYKLLNDIFPVSSSYYSRNDKNGNISGNIIYSNNIDNYTETLRLGSYYDSKRSGIFAPVGQTPRIAFSPLYGLNLLDDAFLGYNSLSTVTNMLSRDNEGPQIRTSVREMRKMKSNYDFLAVPFSLFLAMGAVIGFTASIIYPTYERAQRTRSLQYSNGVSPISLWSAYLLFELQLIIIVSVVMVALISAGTYTSLFYGIGYIFGAIFLAGIATVLGCFILSLYFTAKLAYVCAVLIHLALLLIYLIGVALTATFAPALDRFDTHNQIAAGLGLTSPAANLARAFLIASNSYSFLCGKYGEIATPENAFAYNLYGGVYFNLILQILFLSLVLMGCEYSVFTRISHRFRRRPHNKGYIASQPDGIELESSSTRKSGGDKPLLECFSLHKSFKGTEAVHDVTLSVSSNETMALLGPNGAGKSTTINMIRGQFKPDSGDIFVRDKSVLSQLVEARAETGVCPQEDAVDDLTVRKTLKFYAEIRGVSDPERNAQIVMEALGIQDFKHKRVSKLSGGTRRKLSVAIALLGNPPVLLLDEPSTGLDAVSKRTLWKTLKNLSKDRATLLTTHSMEEVEALATNVSIIAVRLLASGTTASLREEYGGFWHVRAVVDSGHIEKVHESIYEIFGESVEDFVKQSGQIRFSAKKDNFDFVRAMKAMEGLKREGEVLEYSINGTTLQEVFLNVCGKEKI